MQVSIFSTYLQHIIHPDILPHAAHKTQLSLLVYFNDFNDVWSGDVLKHTDKLSILGQHVDDVALFSRHTDVVFSIHNHSTRRQKTGTDVFSHGGTLTLNGDHFIGFTIA